MSSDPVQLSNSRVRNMSVQDLGLTAPDTSASSGAGSSATPSSAPEPTPLPDGDELLVTVKKLLDEHGGVILSGPPGTSKSWYAARLAMSLAGNSARVRFVQFHASYQYEDFVQGYVPNDSGGGFTLKGKHLLELAEDAKRETAMTHVLVIDELSRGDAARIFGEALTYVEKTKRGLAFSLASGEVFAIPPNLVFLATMNPLDRGVDEVDAAFERRFAKIAMDPSPKILEEFLTANAMDPSLRDRVVRFFEFVNHRAKDNPATALGHTFFLSSANEGDLKRLWDHQLRFFFEKAFRLDPHGHREVREHWDAVLNPSPDTAPAS